MPSLPAVFVELKATTSQFTSQFGEAKKTVDDFTKSSTTGLQKMEQVGKVAFLGLAGAATAFGGLAVKAALDGQQAHAQLVQAVQNSGTAFSSVSPAVEEMSGKFAKLGYENDQVEAALARMVQATGDTKLSMSEMGLAADIARARNMDLTEVSGDLGKVLAGNMRGMMAFGLTTKDAAGNTLTAAQAVAELNGRFGGAAQADANTYAGQMRKLNAEYKNTQEAIGNMLLPALASLAGGAADALGWLDKHREVALGLGAVIAGPLVGAMSAYIAKQAVAFTLGTVDTVKKIGGAIMTVLVPATEAEEGALTGAATAEAFLTGGLSIIAGAAAIAGVAFLNHSSASKTAAAGMDGAADSAGGLSTAEADLGDETDTTTGTLKAQADLLKQLNGDTNAQQSEVLKLIGDQNSLDGATRKLKESTGANSEVTKQAAQHAKDLKQATADLKRANDDVTTAIDKQATAQAALNKLLAPQPLQKITDAADAHEAANDRLTRANIDVKDKTNDLTAAIAQYGAGSAEATLAQLDLNGALREVHTAQEDVDTTTQALGESQRQTVGTTEQITQANKDLTTANNDVTTAQDKQKEAQTNLNTVLANRGAVEAAKTDTQNLAQNTLAWQQATAQLNTDWGTLQGTLAANPGLRDQLVSQIKTLKESLPKGADTSAINTLLDKLTNWGTTLSKTAAPGSLLEAIMQGKPLFGNTPAGAGPGGGGPSLESLITGGISIAGGAAEGAVVQARPGGRLMLTAEAGRDEAILPLPDNWRAAGLGAASGGGVSIGAVTIVVAAGNYDENALADKVRDKLLALGRNNVNVGLS